MVLGVWHRHVEVQCHTTFDAHKKTSKNMCVSVFEHLCFLILNESLKNLFCGFVAVVVLCVDSTTT